MSEKVKKHHDKQETVDEILLALHKEFGDTELDLEANLEEIKKELQV